MNEIKILDNINADYYKTTIKNNPEITLDGFYSGAHDDNYNLSREQLLNNYELIFLCDEWLNIFCFQTPYIRHKVPIEKILKHIGKYYEKDIPLGHLLLAIKHRKERHTVDAKGKILELYIDKKVYTEYLEIYG